MKCDFSSICKDLHFHYCIENKTYLIFFLFSTWKTVVLYNFFIGCKIVFCFLISNSESTFYRSGRSSRQLSWDWTFSGRRTGAEQSPSCCCTKRPECRPKRSFNFGNSVDSGPKHALQKHIDADATHEAAAAGQKRTRNSDHCVLLVTVYVHTYS